MNCIYNKATKADEDLVSKMWLYEDERPLIRSGDILLWSDTPGIVSKVIQRATGSRYSHTGLILRTRKEGVLFTFESTSQNLWKQGVQINLLSDRVYQTKGKLFVRQLNKPLSEEQEDLLWSLRGKYMGRPYEASLVDLGLAAIGAHKWSGGTGDTSIFCSELNAIILQELDIMSIIRDPASYVPFDFSPERDSEAGYVNGYSYGPLIQIAGKYDGERIQDSDRLTD